MVIFYVSNKKYFPRHLQLFLFYFILLDMSYVKVVGFERLSMQVIFYNGIFPETDLIL